VPPLNSNYLLTIPSNNISFTQNPSLPYLLNLGSVSIQTSVLRMKKMLTSLLIAFTLISWACISVEAENAQPEIQVIRYVQIMNGGLVMVEDTFTLKANQAEPIMVSRLKVGFSDAFIPERRSFLLWDDGDWVPLEYEKTDIDGPELLGFDIILPSTTVLEADTTLRIKAIYYFSDLATEDRYRSTIIPVYPSTPLNISSIAFRMELPQNAEFIDIDAQLNFTEALIDDRWTLEHESKALAPLQTDNATVTYVPSSDDNNIINCKLSRRSISVKQRSLKIEDTYVITNHGEEINRFHLNLPLYASNVKATDSVGPIKIRLNTVEGEEGYIEAILSPRSSVAADNIWRFTVEYSIPQSPNIQRQDRSSTITYPAKGFPYPIQKLEVVFTLPEGASFISSEPEPTSIEEATVFTQRILLSLGEVLPYDNAEVELTYSRDIVWSFLRPIEWMLLFAVPIVGLILLRRRRPTQEEAPAEVKPTPLKELIRNYRQRVALLVESEALEGELDRGEISRERFDQRTSDLTRRQRDLLQVVRRLERQVMTDDTRIQRALRELREAEAEMEKTRSSMRDLEVRLRSRRVSRRDYRRRRSEYLRSRRRSIRRVEQALATLEKET